MIVAISFLIGMHLPPQPSTPENNDNNLINKN